MAFQDDIKKTLEYYGYDTMESEVLPNILADTSEEYNNNPALKNIFKDFFHEGNGKKVLDLQLVNQAQRELKLKQIGDSFAKKNGYAYSIVNYIISCISYALGWSNSVSEPSLQQRDRMPEKVSSDPINLQRALIELKLEYTNQLSELYTKPVYKLFYIQPGYFSAQALSTLRLTENKIKIVSQALGINQDDWCQRQLQAYIDANEIKKDANKKRILTRLGIPSAIAVIAGLGTSGVIISENNLDSYNAELPKIEQFVSSQDYDKAISGIADLNQKYSGSLGVSSAIDESNAKIPELLDAQVSEIIADGHYDDAISWLESKRQQFSSDATLSANIADRITNLTQEKATLIDSEIPNLLNNIKTNNGHLNDDGKTLLRKLLNVNPNDYWLKFIASKECEFCSLLYN